MSTLRQAAQQALEAMDKATRFMSDSDYKKLNEAIDTLRAALAEPEPEQEAMCDCPARDMPFGRCCKAPTPRKPLTDDEIDNICKSFRLGYTDTEFARAIERAHGIKEQEHE